MTNKKKATKKKAKKKAKKKTTKKKTTSKISKKVSKALIENHWKALPDWQSDNILEVDPFKKSYWNALQTIGWVHLGSVEWVRLTDDDNTNWGSTRRKVKVPGHRTQWRDIPNKRPSIRKLEILGVAMLEARFNKADEAGEELIKKLSNGELTCLGVANNQGDVKKILPISWADLIIDYDKGIARPPDLLRQGATKWHNLKFRSADLAKIWPKKSVEVNRTIKAENACKIWLQGLMANGADKENPKNYYRNEAIKNYGVGKNAFNRAWVNAINSTKNTKWSEGGRPKKKN